MTVQPNNILNTIRSEIEIVLPVVSDDGIGESNLVSGSQECTGRERSRVVDL